jgi:uncharacterized iron-regulated membrane protein
MRRLLQTTHRWLGLALLLPLVLQGLSGAILTLEPPFRPLVAIATTPGEPGSINAIVAAGCKAATDMHAVRYLPPSGPARAAEIGFAPLGIQRGTTVVLVDPVLLTPIGPAEPIGGPVEFIRRLHTSFLVPEFGGRAIVGWVGIGLLLLTLIGVALWWPKRGLWRDGFTMATAARGVRFQRRLHGAAGAWGLAMLVLTSTTGAALGFPQTVRAALGLQAGGAPRQARSAPAPFVADLDAALVLARVAAPGNELRAMFLSANANDPIRMFLAPPGQVGAVNTTVVTVDAASTRVVSLQAPQAFGAAETTLRWMHDLHEGQALGLAWRLVTAATGLLLPLMAITGATMWLLRRRNRKRTDFARAAAQAGQ